MAMACCLSLIGCDADEDLEAFGEEEGECPEDGKCDAISDNFIFSARTSRSRRRAKELVHRG